MHTRQFCQKLLTLTLFALLMISNVSHAGMIDLMLFGETTSASNENNFGLTVGDQVSLKATFDSASLSGIGSESIFFNQNSGNSLSLFMGDLIFSANNSGEFILNLPTIKFIDGIYSGIDYVAYSGINNAPENLFSYGSNWGSITSSGNIDSQLLGQQGSSQWLTGTWDNNSATLNKTPDIPEPAPLVLAAIGILGAWVSSRRRKIIVEGT